MEIKIAKNHKKYAVVDKLSVTKDLKGYNLADN